MIFLINILVFNFLFVSKIQAQTISSPITPTVFQEPTPTQTPAPTISINPNSGVYLNEFLPNPEDGVEWVELINTNNFEIQINGWKIGDSTSIAKTIPATNISPGGFYVWEINQSYLNNGIDSVRLINNLGTVVDSFNYAKISNEDLTWTKSNGSWCFAVDSKGQANNSCFVPTNVPTSTPIPPTNTPVPTNTPTKIPTLTPTKIPSSTPTSVLTPTPTPTEIVELDQTLYPTPDASSGSVLGTDIKNSLDQKSDNDQNNFSKIFPGILIALGGLMLLTPLILAKIKHEKQVLE